MINYLIPLLNTIQVPNYNNIDYIEEEELNSPITGNNGTNYSSF